MDLSNESIPTIAIAMAFVLYKLVSWILNKKKNTKIQMVNNKSENDSVLTTFDYFHKSQEENIEKKEEKVTKSFEEIFRTEFSKYDDWPIGTNRVTFFSENYRSGFYSYDDQESLRKKFIKIKGQYKYTTLEQTVGTQPLIIIDNSSAGNMKHGIYISGHTDEIVFKSVFGKTLEVSVWGIEDFDYNSSSDTLTVQYRDSGIEEFKMPIGKRVGFSVSVLEDVFDEFIKRKYE